MSIDAKGERRASGLANAGGRFVIGYGSEIGWRKLLGSALILFSFFSIALGTAGVGSVPHVHSV